MKRATILVALAVGLGGLVSAALANAPGPLQGAALPAAASGGPGNAPAGEDGHPGAPREERYAGTLHIRRGLTVPSVRTLSVGGDGVFEFPVAPGARALQFSATWDPLTPAAERLEFLLYVEREDGSWDAVAEAAGAREVAAATLHPTPGTYHLYGHPDGPVGAAIRQDVKVEVIVVS